MVAWLWARTVRSPNPAFADVDVPLASSFLLSASAGREAWVDPVVIGHSYRFVVRTSAPLDRAALQRGTRAGKAQDFFCLMSGAPVARTYIRDEAKAGRLGERLMAIVVDVGGRRVYVSPTQEAESAARAAASLDVVREWRNGPLSGQTPTRALITGGVCSAYGLTTWGDLYTARQIAVLATFAQLITDVRSQIERDAAGAGFADDGQSLHRSGTGARAYAEAVSTYLALAFGRLVDYGSSLATWRSKDNAMRSALAKQALPMTWDFAEGSVFGDSSSGFSECVEAVASVLDVALPGGSGFASQQPAQSALLGGGRAVLVSTDPPYYNNIGYGELSDFFMAWLRPVLRPLYREVFATIAAPKNEELVAITSRHGGADEAERFFLQGMTRVMHNLASGAHPAFPLTIYYAFKQAETSADDGTTSTGWETFLDAVVRAGLSISGTWPMRTEGDNRQVGIEANALASSIILVCRPRASDAATISRRQFTRELQRVLPSALDAMTRGAEGRNSPIAPVDLSQAIIGPGMEVFTHYTAVLEADGTPMSVRAALALINRFLADDDFDADTQFCLAWFEQHGWRSGKFGSATVLAQAKGTAVDSVRAAGVVESRGGEVRLLRPSEYETGWDPSTDGRVPVWEVLHQLIRAFRAGGEDTSGGLLGAVQAKAEAARQLAYRLYTLCERAGWAEDARTYNDLIISWPAIESAGQRAPALQAQATLFDA